MKKTLCLILLLIACSGGWAQTSVVGGGSFAPLSGSADPNGSVNCNPANTDQTTKLYYRTATAIGWYSCTATNTWTLMGAAGSGLPDPGGNGIVKRTALNTSAVAVQGTDYVGIGAGAVFGNFTYNFAGAAHTLPVQVGLAASKPATCTQGEIYFATDATAGQNLYFCSATNTWTQQLNSGAGGGLPTLPTSPDGVAQTVTSTPSGGVGGAAAWALPGVAIRASTCTSNVDTILATDRAKYVTWSDASPCAVTLPAASSTGFASNFAFKACNIGAGTATITPTTSTISYTTGSAYTSGASSLALTTGQCATIYSDNTNYFANVFSASSGLPDPGSNGIVARTGAGPTVSARTIAGTSPIGVTNGDGVSGNPTVACATCVTSAASLTANQPVAGAGSQGSATATMVPATLTDGATITWAIASNPFATATVTLGGNRTLNITNPVQGATYILKIVQDATGSRTLTLGTGCTWKVINGGTGAITLTTTANAVDILSFWYDGTNCNANLGKNYN